MCIRDRPSEVRPEIVTWEKLCEAIQASGKAYNMEMIQKAYELANNCLLYTSIVDLLDIIIIAFLIYQLLGIINRTRAGQLAKGALLVLSLIHI